MPLTTKDWPYTVQLIKLNELFVDQTYQRPPQEQFVEKLISEFDETLVGTLDVAERLNPNDALGPAYAILDGAQRYEAVKKFKKNVWCAVYTDMSLREEAMFFYKKNKNRRSVHPYYQFRALMVTGDKKSIEINSIIESEGYKLGIGASQDNVITAIRAVEDAYSMSALHRKESLSPTVHMLREAFYGRKGGKEGTLIKGLGKFFQSFPDNELDWNWLLERLAGQNPQTLLGRADDRASSSRQPTYYHLARDIADIYNRNRKAGSRLSLRLIQARS